MSVLLFTSLVVIGSFAAGFIGSLTGLGGGVVVIPYLTLLLGVEMRYAIGASLISVIATSSGAAAAYVREGYANIRVGMFLEIATTVRAVGGAFLAARLPVAAIAIVFGVVLLPSAVLSIKRLPDRVEKHPSSWLAGRLRLDGSYPTPEGPRTYHVRNIPAGFGLMVVAGLISGLLGIGSGALKVLAMDQAMRLPFKVSTATSNFMIGVTAAASAGVYLNRGYVSPGLTMPVMLGVLVGSALGARMLAGSRTPLLRGLFALALVAVAIQMIVKGIAGEF